MAEFRGTRPAIDPTWARRIVRALRLAEYAGQASLNFIGCREPLTDRERTWLGELVTEFEVRLLTAPRTAAFAPFVAQALTEIDAHACDPHFRVTAIGRAPGISASTLARRMRAETGATAVEHVRGTRIASARRLLAETTLTIKEVAALAGFDSTSSLDVNFHEATGMTPSEFRKGR